MTRLVAIGPRTDDTWRMRLMLTVLVLLAAACLPGNARAFEREEALKAQHIQYPEADRHRTVQSDGMSLSEAIQSVRSRTGGKVISAETKVQGGREVHYIKVLKDGRVRTHTVNGRRV